MKMKQKLTQSVIVLLILILSVVAVQAQPIDKPKNIIMMIGDGMGIAHITANDIENGPMQLRRFKKLGMQFTSSADNLITDSAAAGTVLATGKRTNNKFIGVDVNKKPLKNVFEYARESGKAVGFVVTSMVNHATPAAFSAHNESRNNYNEIAEEQALSNIDLMIGGGLTNFIPSYMPGSRRKDDKNLLFALRRKMPVILTIDAFRQLDTPKKLAAILSDGHLPLASKRDYTLGELTRKGIEILAHRPEGFFMMVEGSQIDLMSHKNDYKEILRETADFDTAVKEALDFAEKDGNTLVVVTADHETGGLTLVDGSLTERKAKPSFSTDQHSATMVAVFSYGPGADLFTGMYENTHIGKTLIELVK